MSTEKTTTENEQYTFIQIILIWLLRWHSHVAAGLGSLPGP